jgi:hypothetical protein
MTNPIVGPSGPSIYSKRTDLPKKPDMDLGSISYSEGQETAMLNTAAPKSKTRGIADDVGGRPSNAVPAVTPLFANSQKATEDIMTGAPTGPGAGTEALIMQSKFATRKTSDILEALIPYDETGEAAILFQEARSKGQ